MRERETGLGGELVEEVLVCCDGAQLVKERLGGVLLVLVRHGGAPLVLVKAHCDALELVRSCVVLVRDAVVGLKSGGIVGRGVENGPQCGGESCEVWGQKLALGAGGSYFQQNVL